MSIPHDPETASAEDASITPSASSTNAPTVFGCSLSGGGFRATLFHLGVCRLLHEANLLPRVKFISGVSGGGILAAHLALNWARYIGADFDSAGNEIVKFTQRDVRNRILRRWLLGWLTLLPRLFWHWSRVKLLCREYRSLYGERKMYEFPIVYKGAAPRVVLQCTNIVTGLPCSFGVSGLMLYEEHADGRGVNLADDEEITVANQLSVADAVAASSAFPPMFPPLKIPGDALGAGEQEHGAQYFTDGGVFDNIGMDRPLWWYLKPHEHAVDQIRDFLIIDAEGSFSKVVARPWRYSFMLPRNVRATEILMKRVSTLNWKYLSAQPVSFIRIPAPPTPQQRPVPSPAEAMRTDLDRFTDLEVEELVRSGYIAARSALLKEGWIGADFPDSRWCPVRMSTLDPARRASILARGRYRRWLPLFFDARDRIWWLLVALLGGLLYAIWRQF